MPLPVSLIDSLLAEDTPDGDLTTLSLGIGGRPGRMMFRARNAMTVAGIEIAAAMIRRAGADAQIVVPSGTRAKAGDLLLKARGDAKALHTAWKSSQTLVEILSGIATAARSLVDAVEAVDPAIRVACTRKTVPGARRLSVMAVRAGGAVPHRLGLSETILVFAEHRAFMPDANLAGIADVLRREAPEKKIGVEVKSVEEAGEAIEAGFDIIQLEKFEPGEVADVRSLAEAAQSRALLAAAGGIHPDNASDYVRAGAGVIVSSWPYTARPADVAVAIEADG
ncbi:ModD protein [Rhodomicrobium sp. Az07]|uniref:ModD protein n=1 Tax=Rhodomicrobium sp. Az07 TaxID=2839034 RepID=UPI001BE52C81|nr:ModD protein [Rhodomicrobium sp. Az07]MBT3071013.1 ModD protein [Rhodomicrobium sp. Az07]